MVLQLWGGLNKMFEMIIAGLGEIFGFELVVGLLLIFSFILMVVSRGAGITATLGTFFLTIYLFSNNKLGGYYLISNDWFITVVLLIGLFIGFMVYMIFGR